MSQLHVLTISETDRSAEDSVIISFRQPPFGRIHYLPGQYITLRFEMNSDVHFRSYSISSSPRLDSQLAIGVRRVAGGLISNYLVDEAVEGMELEVMVPRGRFFLDNSVKEHRHVRLMAGGSGITPLFSILRSTLFNEPNSTVSLLLSDRALARVMFRADLLQLKEMFSDRFKLQIHESGISGRISTEALDSFISQTGAADSSLTYLCGPEGLMKICEERLAAAGVPATEIFKESFTETIDESTRRSLVNGKTRTVTLELRGEEYTITVPPGSTVLDAAMDRGIHAPHSCKQGTCASCLSTLINGEVVMAKEEALLDFERERGKVLACQAQPVSDGVYISFDRKTEHD